MRTARSSKRSEGHGARAGTTQAHHFKLPAGRDYLTQTEEAVRAVLQVRPDMTAFDALAAVNLVRHE